MNQRPTNYLFRLIQILLLLLTFIPAVPAQAQAQAHTRTATTSIQQQPVTPPSGYLTGPAAGDALDIALAYLRANHGALGLTADDIRDLVVKDRYVTAHNGVTHLYLRQRLDGIEVYNGDININITRDGRILNLGNRFVSDLRNRVNTNRPALPAVKAVQGVATTLKLRVTEPLVVTTNARSLTQAQEISSGGISAAPIPVHLIYQPMGKEVRLAWNLVLRLKERPDWLNLRADAVSGELLSTVNWTSYSQTADQASSQMARTAQTLPNAQAQGAPNSYLVYALPTESPDDGERTLLTAPADPVASPFGWHDVDGVAGADYTTTRGNNTFTYADLYEPDGYSDGDVTTDAGPGLAFVYPITFTQPATTYIDAVLTNLFYITNWMHDVTYHYGFDEASGNFQTNNYGRGGFGDDAVSAEAFNAFGVANADFAAPPDGLPGRLQTYVGQPRGALKANSPAAIAGDYFVGGASFGPPSFNVTADLALVDDGDATNGTTVTDGCQQPFVNAAAINGKVAVLDRGTCSFKTKVRNAQQNGALGVIVINNIPGPPSGMGDDPNITEPITIPALLIGLSDGNAFKVQLAAAQTVNVTLFRGELANAGALDNGTIIHEYGHGVSTRLTGGPSNSDCLFTLESAGMGEGWSDFLQLVFTARTGDTGAMPQTSGNWLDGQPTTGPGIRHFPYSTDQAVNPLTFASVLPMDEIHDVGEVWASLLWEMYWQLVDVYGFDSDLIQGAAGNQMALQLVLDGMKLQPCNPTFVEARDAILAAEQVNNGGADQCRLWVAFAKRGLGYGATAGSSEIVADGIESFALPPACALAVAPPLADICLAQNASFDVAIGTLFQGAVTLSVDGAPAGATVNITPNPVTAPTHSTITIGNTNAVTPGLYNLQLNGVDNNASYSTAVELAIAAATPAAPLLFAPATGAVDVEAEPTFEWEATPEATYYLFELSTDPAFTTLVYSTTVRTTIAQAPFALRADQHYYWRVTASNGCGISPVAMADFTVRRFPRVLLVDDDRWETNSFFDATPFYTEALDALQIPYEIWDTGDGSAPPQRLNDLINYATIIWSSGIVGPGLSEENEALLSSFLAEGKCLFVSSQYYHTLRGLTPFMQDYLGVATVQDDDNQGESWHTVITGTAPLFADLGPYPLTFVAPGSNYSDIITPDAIAGVAFDGNGGPAAIYKDGGHYRTSYWGVDFTTLPDLTARTATLGRLLTWCDFPTDLRLEHTVKPEGVLQPGQPLTYTLAFHNSGAAVAQGVIITAPLPNLLNSVQIDSSVPVTPLLAGVLAGAWQVDDLAPGATGVITITAIVSPALAADANLAFAAQIGSTSNAGASADSQPATIQRAVVVPRVSLSASTVAEMATVVTVTAQLDQINPYAPVQVSFATSDGTAQAGSDYNAAAGVLTIPPNEPRAITTVVIIDDAIAEPDETFAVSLSNPQGAALAAPSTQTITIGADDQGASDLHIDVTSDPPTNVVVEEGDIITYSITITNSGGPAHNVSVAAILLGNVSYVAGSADPAPVSTALTAATATTTLVWQVGTLPTNGVFHARYAVQVVSGGSPIINALMVTTSDGTVAPGPNVTHSSTPTPAPTLERRLYLPLLQR